MSQVNRINDGGRIDRSKPLSFRFDGLQYTGYAGDTLASALLANNVSVVARSFKYHRPRGLFGAGFEEPNVLVQLETGARTEPNLKATQVELYDGLDARAVNCWPSARFDVWSVFRFFKKFMPSGFYYKTFIWPSWHVFEWVIRAAAGLGLSPTGPDPDRYDKRHDRVDVLVIGGGEQGIDAAIKAAEEGKQVLLLDDKTEIGGALLYEPVGVEGRRNSTHLAQRLKRASELPNLRMIPRCTAFGYYDHDHVCAVQVLGDAGLRQRLWHIRAGEVALATGAIERPIVFPNNDRPGVMLASAARQYLHRYGVKPGSRVVFATNNDSVYALALELKNAGVQIAAVLDSRDCVDGPAVTEVRGNGIRIETSCAPTNTFGKPALTSVEFHRIDAASVAQPGTGQKIDCDCLLVAGGWNPTVHLFSQSGGSLRFDEKLQSFVPVKSVQSDRSVGAAAGDLGGINQQALWSVNVEKLGRTQAYSWVDYASDVTEGDLRLAVRENFGAVEHLKRYTTTGMMADQGKTSNVNAIGILSGLAGRAPGEVGTTKFRPPFNPVTFGAIAGTTVGPLYNSLRKLPTDSILHEAGALLEDYGGWSRPVCMPRKGEQEHDAVVREVHAVRSGVGLIDYSPLGKILVHGSDAATLLQRIYVNNMKTLKPGNCRYGLMLGEDGIVFDDGVLTRWDELTFQVGTTSGHAERITDWLEEWLQCEWTDLDVVVEPVTTQWSVIMVAGPNARTLLERLNIEGIDLSAASFPHMTARQGHIGSVPVRIMRVSFTGELSFEVSVPWSYGAGLWRQLVSLGGDLGVTPFGIEALMAMRIEKGYLHVGTETDGSTMPQDLGFAEIIAKKTDDFAGRRSTMTPEGLRADRMQMVGLAPVDGKTVLPVGGHVVSKDFNKPPVQSQGWVTSSVMSPTLNRPVALGMVSRGRARMGETVRIFDAHAGVTIAATIVEQVAYDPKGERLHG